MQPVLGDIALYVAVAMAIFAVLFGTRHIDATEHQDGLMLAIATESIVKLVAFVGVGVFVTFWMFDGPLSLFAQALERPDTAAVLTREPVLGTFVAMTLLSLFAIILLPRQFHVTVVENNSEDEIRRASWLFPLYLVLINLFVVPIALAGLLTFSRRTRRQRHVRARVAARRPFRRVYDRRVCRRAFGGDRDGDRGIGRARDHGIERHRDAARIAAARGTDHRRETSAGLLLAVRRMAIFVILFLAYVYYRLAGDAQLASIGLLSFAAVAQLAPAFFGGLIWRRGYRPRRIGRDDDRDPGRGPIRCCCRAWWASASWIRACCRKALGESHCCARRRWSGSICRHSPKA